MHVKTSLNSLEPLTANPFLVYPRSTPPQYSLCAHFTVRCAPLFLFSTIYIMLSRAARAVARPSAVSRAMSTGLSFEVCAKFPFSGQFPCS